MFYEKFTIHTRVVCLLVIRIKRCQMTQLLSGASTHSRAAKSPSSYDLKVQRVT